MAKKPSLVWEAAKSYYWASEESLKFFQVQLRIGNFFRCSPTRSGRVLKNWLALGELILWKSNWWQSWVSRTAVCVYVCRACLVVIFSTGHHLWMDKLYSLLYNNEKSVLTMVVIKILMNINRNDDHHDTGASGNNTDNNTNPVNLGHTSFL